MPETVRFAPSPTGELHIGNVRSAFYNWFERVRTGGTFILRYDDTDTARSEQRFADQIAADLAYLGIVPDRVERQSARLSLYDEAAAKLKAAGALYPCYETAEELDFRRARQRARGLPPVYDRAALRLTDEERAELAATRSPHWRFKLPEGARTFEDRCRGEETVNFSALSDPVLIREDGSYLYTLPSVVDDIEMGVSLVLRGEDHVTNTGVQVALFEALGAAPPSFGHHNLLVRSDGAPLSKRDNPLSIRRLAEDGYEAMAVAALASLTGTSKPVAAAANLEALANSVQLGDVSRAPATFDPADLARLNAAIVHELPVDAVALDLPTGVDKALFWETVRGNLAFRHEVSGWAAKLAASPEAVVIAAEANGAIAPEDGAFFAAAMNALPPIPWGEDAFKVWTGALKEASGRKGKALFMPLRVALTGEQSGPELGPWMRLLGEDAVRDRLSAFEAGAIRQSA